LGGGRRRDGSATSSPLPSRRRGGGGLLPRASPSSAAAPPRVRAIAAIAEAGEEDGLASDDDDDDDADADDDDDDDADAPRPVAIAPTNVRRAMRLLLAPPPAAPSRDMVVRVLFIVPPLVPRCTHGLFGFSGDEREEEDEGDV
jgi:hypothetical protein